MSSSTFMNNSQSLFSESFLNYLNSGENLNRPTYCEEKTKSYHDSSYIWCRVCDKIFCTKCSMNHLINNQLNHYPIEKIFLKKELFDLEFSRDYKKIKDLRDKMVLFFKEKNGGLSLSSINSLKDSFDRFKLLTNEIFGEIIPNLLNKYNECIEKLAKSLKDVKIYDMNEDKVRIRCEEIINNYKNIEKKYTKNESFVPKMLKPYYEELSNSYRDLLNLNEVVNNNTVNVNHSNNNDRTNSYYSKINSSLNQAIKIVDNFKNEIKTCLDIKLN